MSGWMFSQGTARFSRDAGQFSDFWTDYSL